MPNANINVPLLYLALDLGTHFLLKWQDRLKQDSHATVARQMRKQGIPLEIATKLIFGRGERFAHLNQGKVTA